VVKRNHAQVKHGKPPIFIVDQATGFCLSCSSVALITSANLKLASGMTDKAQPHAHHFNNPLIKKILGQLLESLPHQFQNTNMKQRQPT